MINKIPRMKNGVQDLIRLCLGWWDFSIVPLGDQFPHYACGGKSMM